MEETSPALTDLFYQYTHLLIGGKEIACPYWRNRLILGLTGPFGGKGRPEQIVEATKEAAQEAKVNLQSMSEKEVLAFMKRKKIGVDCSGFVFWLLDALVKERGGRGMADLIPRPPGTLAQRQASADKLTSRNLTVPVEKVSEVRVGDTIRLDGGKHIAIVLKVEREKGAVKTIEYAHSSERTAIEGVHQGRIKIRDSSQSLAAQEWEEKLPYLPGDGLKRLKIWA